MFEIITGTNLSLIHISKPELPRELERKMQISDFVMRYMVEKQDVKGA